MPRVEKICFRRKKHLVFYQKIEPFDRFEVRCEIISMVVVSSTTPNPSQHLLRSGCKTYYVCMVFFFIPTRIFVCLFLHKTSYPSVMITRHRLMTTYNSYPIHRTQIIRLLLSRYRFYYVFTKLNRSHAQKGARQCENFCAVHVDREAPC